MEQPTLIKEAVALINEAAASQQAERPTDATAALVKLQELLDEQVKLITDAQKEKTQEGSSDT